jgi:hypothetical protein
VKKALSITGQAQTIFRIVAFVAKKQANPAAG